MPLITDPDMKIYKRYGVVPSWKGLFKTFSAPSLMLEATVSEMKAGIKLGVTGKLHMIPADFLINPDLTIHTAYYGKHAGDHIPFEDIDKFLNA